MTKQICCNCKKKFEGVVKLKHDKLRNDPERQKRNEANMTMEWFPDHLTMEFDDNGYVIKLCTFDFCEHCNSCQLIKDEKEE